MTRIDPEQERRRLAQLYSQQSDSELERMADQAFELDDIAREVLREELTSRGLPFALVPFPSGDEVEIRDVVTIRQFRDLPEALLAKASLDSAGIECALLDDNMVRLDWFISNLLGGVKLQVKTEDAPAAEEILNQPIPDDFEVSGIGPYEQPRCPKCGSLDVNFRETAPAAYVSAWLISLPIPLHRRAWHCHSCGVEWEDDGIPGPATASA